MTAQPRPGLFYRGKWLWMWPNWTLSLFDGGMNTSRINPLDAGRTELIYNFYFADLSPAGAARRDKTVADNLEEVIAAEEKAIRANPMARTTDLLKTVFGN